MLWYVKKVATGEVVAFTWKPCLAGVAGFEFVEKVDDGFAKYEKMMQDQIMIKNYKNGKSNKN